MEKIKGHELHNTFTVQKVMFMRWEENKLKLEKCKDPISKLSMMKPRFDWRKHTVNGEKG